MFSLLWWVACNTDPAEGTFVGNPGMAELAAAPAAQLGAPEGRARVTAGRVLPCGGGAPAAVRAPEELIFEATWELAGGPIVLPGGRWCGLELDVNLSFTVARPGDLTRYIVDTGDVSLRLVGPALEVSSRVLGVQLGGSGWLAALDALDAEGEVVVADHPQVLERIRSRLAFGSALFGGRDELDVAQDGAPGGESAPGLWNAEPPTTPTTPTTPTDTGRPTTPLAWTLWGESPAFVEMRRSPSLAIDPSGAVFVAGDTLEGRLGGVWVSSSGGNGGDLREAQVPDCERPAVQLEANGEPVLLCETPEGLLHWSSFGGGPEDWPGLRLGASAPALARTDESLWMAWREGGDLWVRGWRATAEAQVANGVTVGPALAGARNGTLVVVWGTEGTHPLTGARLTRLMAGTFSPMGTARLVALSDDSVSLRGVNVGARDDGAVVSWLDHLGAHVVTLDGLGAVSLRLDPGGSSVSAALLDELLLIATADEDGVGALALHERATGRRVGEVLERDGAGEVRVVAHEALPGRAAWASASPDFEGWLELVVVEQR